MATKGYSKWIKYFRDKSVETTVNRKTQFFITDNRNDATNWIYPGEPISVLPSSSYELQYPIRRGTSFGKVLFSAIAKPKQERGATENLRIKSVDLILLGKEIDLAVDNTIVKVRCFETPNELIQSIVFGLKQNIFIYQELFDDVLKILNNPLGSIVWNAAIESNEIAEIGKYLGELLVGLILLLENKATRFFVPSSPSFSGIDSWVEIKGNLKPISSKYGIGAKASLFNCFKKCSPQSSSVFKKLHSFYDGSPINTVYNYTFDWLGVNAFDQFEYRKRVKNKRPLEKDHDIFIEKISKLTTNQTILQHIPNSTTALISRLLATRLNEDEESLHQIEDYLLDQGFIQVHLDIQAWSSFGTIKLNFFPVEDLLVYVTGGKSSTNDIDCKQGLVNYVLYPPK